LAEEDAQMTKLRKEPLERLLKEDLVCWKCDRTMKNMPELKNHLQNEHDKVIERLKKQKGSKASETPKRRRDEDMDDSPNKEETETNQPPPPKRRETGDATEVTTDDERKDPL
jgi:aprataxin